MFKADIVADSINSKGERITTMLVTFPRMILAEVNTHRALSKNSASSRAIPFNKMVQMVKDNPFIPMKWMKDHSGMQGNEYFEDELYINTLTDNWLKARDEAVRQAEYLNKSGVTKQICNRLLEPFMYHTALITGTEWENFFALRVHEAAEIHLQKIAGMMLEAYNNSTPKVLQDGEWHIPFGDKIDDDRLDKIMPEIQPASMNWYLEYKNNLKVKIATARCARTSYLNFDGKDDYEADIKLHDRLFESGHFSPFEHCAFSSPGTISGNFKGWVQYRKTLPNECRTDDRVIKK